MEANDGSGSKEEGGSHVGDSHSEEILNRTIGLS